jgi:hypothetical protein
VKIRSAPQPEATHIERSNWQSQIDDLQRKYEAQRQAARRFQEQLEEAFRKRQELYAEKRILEAQLAGNIPEALSWMQMKMHRQRKALDRLTARVTRQRFVLRTIEGLGRGLTKDEFDKAKETELAKTSTLTIELRGTHEIEVERDAADKKMLGSRIGEHGDPQPDL